MRGRIWQSAFGIAVLMHLLILGSLGYVLHESLREEIQYIEVTMDELFAEQPDFQLPAAGQQAKVNQDNNSPVQGGEPGPGPVENVAAQAQENAAEASDTPAHNTPVQKEKQVPNLVKNVAAQAQENAAGDSDTPAYGSNISTGNAGTGNNAAGGSTVEGSSNGADNGTGGSNGNVGTSHGAGHGSKRKPKVISGSQPPYPVIARKNRWEGTVSVQVLVSTAGTAQEVRILASSGHDCLDQAVVGEVYRWRFSPALNEEGYPVAAWTTLPVKFDLTNI